MNKKQFSVQVSGFLLCVSLLAAPAVYAAVTSVNAAAEKTRVHAAESAVLGKTAIVDIQRILQNAAQVNAMKEKLKAEFSPRQTQLVSAQNTLKTDIDKLQAEHASMDKKALESLQRQIQAEQTDIQNKQAAFQKDLFAAQDKALESLLDQVKRIIEGVAKQKNLALVLVSNSVAYVQDKVDITPDVLRLMK